MDKNSEIAQMSLTVIKASYEKGEADPNKKRRIVMTSSDTSPDLYDERMSTELFKDFTDRIENNIPIPEPFKSVVCEDGVWCGGMPYLSIAHYHAGKDAKNVPGTLESVYVDGKQLKSKAYLHDTPLGRKLFDALCEDLEQYKSGTPKEKPVRVSIAFLDLEHSHEVEGKTVTFTRKALGQICALCASGTGGKIYKKGVLVHEAATRVPVNQRTDMSLEEKSMGDILTKKDDAASIIGEELAEELEQKSMVGDALVIKSESEEIVEAKKVLEEVETVKSQAQELLDEAKALYEKLQAEKSVPVEETKMEAKVEEKSVEQEPVAKEEVVEQTEEKSVATPSPLDTAFETLKSVIASAGTGDEVQNAFNALGQEVVKAYTPAQAQAPVGGIDAETLKSLFADAIAPLQMEITQLKAQVTGGNVQKNQIPASRALRLQPADLIAKSASQPVRQFSQIEKLARKSVDPSLPI